MSLYQICSLAFDREDILMNKLICGGLESALYVYDLTTKHPVEGYARIKLKVKLL